MLELVVKNIGLLATPVGSAARRGSEQGNLSFCENAFIGVTDGLISEIGTGAPPEARVTIDAKGLLVTPGLVDSHTHLVFGGWRQHELVLKLKGASYLDILQAGGGILSTVEHTRSSTEGELVEKCQELCQQMLAHGTTTCEAKSGYGLNLKDEVKQLNVIKQLSGQSKLDIVATFMGAHAVPKEYKDDREAYIKLVCDEIIPEVAKTGLAKYCDIFCESSVFSVEESRRILLKAKSYGLDLKIHADEIDPIGGAELAAELNAISAEHLIQASDAGIAQMSESGTIAVLLPATSFYLDKPFARARKMLDEGVAVAVATDFNPGSSPNFNLQLPMNLACLKYKLTPEEALTAVTLNAAAAIGMEKILGSVEIGKQADFVIWNCPDLNFLFYRYGNNQVKSVIKKGELAYEN